ncbi:protein SIEVE ELEMENT OCCLUSION B-like [Macadamia integrifolia]|uniref:protein SIEVE ELEMENT OCCLUSION B-like n=1 Tax=Macadamia integrifolia TaxID=60698 RepID=UPI001C52AE5F|nr:protein SIEVE ELEMENT OCCLUSION B-like [Macadamia integrifolia]
MSTLIKTLSSYSWDAKVVLVMAAFAVTYGEFFLLLEGVGANKSKPLETLRSVIKAMVNLIDCIVNFSKLPNQESLDQSVVETTVYWIIRSAVACVPQFFGFLGMGYEYTLSRIENEELFKLLKNLNVSHRHLKEELDRYQQSIDKMKLSAEYEALVQLFATTHIHNIEILNALIKTKDGLPPLFQISTQQRDFTLSRSLSLSLSTDQFLPHLATSTIRIKI